MLQQPAWPGAAARCAAKQSASKPYANAGEAASKDKGLMESLSVDIPLDGLGLIGFPAADAISPVYTIWITLVVMYLGEGCAQNGRHP